MNARLPLTFLLAAVLCACDADTATAPVALSRVATSPLSQMTATVSTGHQTGVLFFGLCGLEDIAYEGDWHSVLRVEIKDDGSQIYNVHLTWSNWNGVGLTSGDTYRIQQVERDRFSFGGAPDYTFEAWINYRFQVSRQGSADNMLIHATYHLLNENVEIIRNEADCRG
jgi:hypothetical protein